MFDQYKQNLFEAIDRIKQEEIDILYETLNSFYLNKKRIFICGNGGSAANANHIEIDMLNIKVNGLNGFDIQSLNSNSPVITCIANDHGYHNIFSKQIEAKSKKNDLLILLSGSGNSSNIINAINFANSLELMTFGIFGFEGGEAIKLVKNKIHIPSNDMQICEDIQMIIFHHISQKFKNLNG